MRVRVIRAPDPTSSDLRIAVQRWSSGQWEHVTYFGMNQSEEANEFAMKLSMTKREPVELAVFEDGQKIGSVGAPPTFNYKQLAVPCDCCVVTIEEALFQIGEEAKHVSSDIYVSERWTPGAVPQLQAALQERNCLANRVRVDRKLNPSEWYVDCAGTCVGSNPQW